MTVIIYGWAHQLPCGFAQMKLVLAPSSFLLAILRQFLYCSYSWFVRQMVYSSDHCKAVVLVLVLLFVDLWFIPQDGLF